MILTAKDDWFPIQIEEYFKLVNCRTGVIWLGKAFDIDVLKAIFMISKTETSSLQCDLSAAYGVSDRRYLVSLNAMARL